MKPPRPGTVRFRILQALARRPGLTTRELADLLGTDIYSVSTALRLRMGAEVRREDVPGAPDRGRWYLIAAEGGPAPASGYAAAGELQFYKAIVGVLCDSLGAPESEVVDAVEDLLRELDELRARPKPPPASDPARASCAQTIMGSHDLGALT